MLLFFICNTSHLYFLYKTRDYFITALKNWIFVTMIQIFNFNEISLQNLHAKSLNKSDSKVTPQIHSCALYSSTHCEVSGKSYSNETESWRLLENRSALIFCKCIRSSKTDSQRRSQLKEQVISFFMRQLLWEHQGANCCHLKF